MEIFALRSNMGRLKKKMDNLKFRLKVWKMKCPDCDTLYLVGERQDELPFYCVCPICESDNSEFMDEITVVEE
jgi:Zn finger protein HypA/HybF involved in hydrogenase expression